MGTGLTGAALAALVFAPSLAVSSVLSTMASHLPERRKLSLHSRCRHCGTEAGLLQSIALLSYLWRRGTCLRCGARRSLRYPILELLTGFLAVACFTHFGFSGRAFVASIFCAVLVVLAAIDFERRLIPNAIVLPATVVVLVGDIAVAPHRTLEWVAAAFAAGFGLLALALLYRGSIGMGDVKLAFLLGAGLGKATLVAFLVGLAATGVVALAVIANRGLGARKDMLPLAPFLALGAVVALLTTG